MREGTSGDTFYIISDGGVRVTKKSAGREEEIRTLARGDYFGEQVRKIIRVRRVSGGISKSNFQILPFHQPAKADTSTAAFALEED